jgi:hypothetical protein
VNLNRVPTTLSLEPFPATKPPLRPRSYPHDEGTEPQVSVFAGNPERYFFQTETTQHNFASAVVMESPDHHSKVQFGPQCQEVTSGYAIVLPYQQLTRIHAPRKMGYRIYQQEALDRMYAADWKKFSSGIAPLVLESSGKTSISESREDNYDEFTVVVNDGGGYELWAGNGAGMKPVPNFVPCRNPNIFLDRVARLAQHRIVKNLKSPDHTSLSGKFSFRIKGEPFEPPPVGETF